MKNRAQRRLYFLIEIKWDENVNNEKNVEKDSCRDAYKVDIYLPLILSSYPSCMKNIYTIKSLNRQSFDISCMCLLLALCMMCCILGMYKLLR